MKKIYLDYNVVSYLRSGNDELLNQKYERIASDNSFIFSPAHIEDIAVSEKRDGIDKQIIIDELEFLSKITQQNALRPITRDFVELCKESPQDCYQRVIEHYGNNDWAEMVDRAIIKDAIANPLGNPLEVNNIEPEDILNKLSYKELIGAWLVNNKIISHNECIESLRWNFSDIENRFSVFEAYVNLAANLLEKIGYFREKETKARSRLHDVSHMIYAAYSDIFVTADKKMLQKTKAIYSMLQVPTKVMSLKEFYEF